MKVKENLFKKLVVPLDILDQWFKKFLILIYVIFFFLIYDVK